MPRTIRSLDATRTAWLCAVACALVVGDARASEAAPNRFGDARLSHCDEASVALVGRHDAVRLVEPEASPNAAAVLDRGRLAYSQALDRKQRRADLRRKTRRALRALKLKSLSSIRRIATRTAGPARSWEALRERRLPGGDRARARVVVRVWVPAGAEQVATFDGTDDAFDAQQQAGQIMNLPRRSVDAWWVTGLDAINDQQGYCPQTLTIETLSLHAPVAALFFEHIFREGLHDVARRVPLLSVRSAEDTHRGDVSRRPLLVEALDFVERGDAFDHRRRRLRYASAGSVIRGFHVKRSNHRLGVAFDINSFDFGDRNFFDGDTNAISKSARHGERDRMAALDRRNLPRWVYEDAALMGYQTPHLWFHPSGGRDWMHIDIPRRPLRSRRLPRHVKTARER